MFFTEPKGTYLWRVSGEGTRVAAAAGTGLSGSFRDSPGVGDKNRETR
jgi:hypothetical protein